MKITAKASFDVATTAAATTAIVAAIGMHHQCSVRNAHGQSVCLPARRVHMRMRLRRQPKPNTIAHRGAHNIRVSTALYVCAPRAQCELTETIPHNRAAREECVRAEEAVTGGNQVCAIDVRCSKGAHCLILTYVYVRTRTTLVSCQRSSSCNGARASRGILTGVSQAFTLLEITFLCVRLLRVFCVFSNLTFKRQS